MEVLVVDDDDAVREAVVKALTRAGYEVTAAENGLAALAAIRMHSFAAIVADVKMEFFDGIQLYRELEAEYPHLRDRLFFISGVAEAPGVRGPLRRSGRTVLRKPFELNDLLARVREVAQGTPGS